MFINSSWRKRFQYRFSNINIYFRFLPIKVRLQLCPQFSFLEDFKGKRVWMIRKSHFLKIIYMLKIFFFFFLIFIWQIFVLIWSIETIERFFFNYVKELIIFVDFGMIGAMLC